MLTLRVQGDIVDTLLVNKLLLNIDYLKLQFTKWVQTHFYNRIIGVENVFTVLILMIK